MGPGQPEQLGQPIHGGEVVEGLKWKETSIGNPLMNATEMNDSVSRAYQEKVLAMSEPRRAPAGSRATMVPWRYAE